MVIVDMIIVY